MEGPPSSVCKVCQGIFQEGHRRRIRLRQIEAGLWESKGSAYNQDIYSHSSGENGQPITDPLNEEANEEANDDASQRSLDGEDLDEEVDEDTFGWSSEDSGDQHRPSNEGESDEMSEDIASRKPSGEEEELRRSSDEDLDEMASEEASKVFSDDEDSSVIKFGDRDYFVYMHYPNLAMLQKSAEHGHCQSCQALMHSLRSHNKNLEEFLDQAQELEVKRLQKLQISGDRPHLAVLDKDESDPDLDPALQMHVEVYDKYGTDWSVGLSLSPEELGEGRLFLSFDHKGFDYEFLESVKLDVFCKPTESSASGHLEGGMSFLASPVDDVDPALDHRPSKHVLMESHIRLVRQWLGECQSQHTCCNDSRTGSLQPLPDRLIEISPIDEEGSHHIRLVEAHKLPKKHIPYVCLSYCWGNTENPSRTTISNIAQYLENIPLDQLPNTIRDAILLCSKLEFWYIWIDSLCIVQDDRDDWMNQAAQMSRIFSKATLTITTPICLLSSESFISKLQEGNPLLALGIPGASLFIIDDSGKSYVLWLWAVIPKDFPIGFCMDRISDWKGWPGIHRDESTWIGRAWTFQEWLLSPRVLRISQFTLWDCLGGYANELNPRSMAKVRRQRDPEALGRDYFTWNTILAEYTSRGITNLSDKLPALAGIAKRYAETHHEHYLAGLWAEDLPLALLWRLAHGRTTNKRNIESPSWSWASVNGQIEAGGCSNAIFDTCVLSYSCRYNPPDSYSTVLGAWIHLEGPLCVVSCDDTVQGLESVATLRLLTVPKNGEARRWKSRFDENQNLDELNERIARRQIFNLLIYHAAGGLDPDDTLSISHEALLLERLGGKQLGFDCYKRLGICEPSPRLGRFDRYDPDYPSDPILEPERWGEVGAAWERTRVHLV